MAPVQFTATQVLDSKPIPPIHIVLSELPTTATYFLPADATMLQGHERISIIQKSSSNTDIKCFCC